MPFLKGERKIAKLPTDYTLVPAVELPNQKLKVPQVPNLQESNGVLTNHFIQQEYDWCAQVSTC